MEIVKVDNDPKLLYYLEKAMTTFTSEDRKRAQQLVDEAPYHPGYEDAVIDKHITNWIQEHLEYRNRHLTTSKKIVEFIKSRHFGYC